MSSRETHFPGLDTLRACAILMVIPRHARELLGGDFFGPTLKTIFNAGWIGVELFFVLSGFLIGSQLLQAVSKHGRVDFKKFYLKRSFRIIPSFYVVLLIYFLWPAFREKPEIDPAWRFMTFIMNYGRSGEAFSHAWSLCIEEHFYLVFPSLVALCVWKPKIFRPVPMICATLIGVALLRYYLWLVNAPFHPAVYRPTHTHIDGLTIGVTLALVRERRPQIWDRFVSRPWMLFISGVVLVLLGVQQSFPEPFAYVFSFTLISLGFGALVATAVSPSFWLSRITAWGASTMAALAFTLYLTHKQMIHLAATIIGDYKSNPTTMVALSIVLMAVASLVIHHGIEMPFLRLRDRVLKKN